MSHDLQADRQAVGIVSRADRGGRLLREVERCREANMLEWLFRIIARRRLVGGVSRDRRRRADQEVVTLDRRYGLLAYGHDLTHGAQGVDRAQAFRAPAPSDNEWQDLGLPIRR